MVLFVCAALASPMFGRNMMAHKSDVSAPCFTCRVVVAKVRQMAPEAAAMKHVLATQVCSKVFGWLKEQVRMRGHAFFFPLWLKSFSLVRKGYGDAP